MRWGKFVLIFQAIVTLIIGGFFFAQVFNIEYHFEEDFKDSHSKYGFDNIIVEEQMLKYEEFKKRFFAASYILVTVSIVELILLWRLFDYDTGTEEFDFNNEFVLRNT